MKNRYIPFGYQIQNGDSVINTEQAATVQHIFYAYTEGQSFKEIAEYLTTSGTAYHFSDNSWNKNIVARILANEIYCGAKGYPAIISKEVYSQAASIRSNKTVTYSAVLKPFRSDMQCACCGERLYWRPRTQQYYKEKGNSKKIVSPDKEKRFSDVRCRNFVVRPFLVGLFSFKEEYRMTNIVNSTLPTQNNHSEKNKPDGVFVIKQGKTNYKVKVFFDHSSGLTAEDRLKRIIQAEAERESA